MPKFSAIMLEKLLATPEKQGTVLMHFEVLL
jgi:hypothetical protein